MNYLDPIRELLAVRHSAYMASPNHLPRVRSVSSEDDRERVDRDRFVGAWQALVYLPADSEVST